MPTHKPEQADQPHVGILLATYNGADCLQEQLDSLAGQTHTNWSLLASDDASKDATREILYAFAAHQNVDVLDGPQSGAAPNFMSLITRSGAHLPENSWIAFCDQDDVWLPDRLALGVTALSKLQGDRPALYCSRTWVVDQHLQGRSLSAKRPREPSFLNALAQNIAAGNTILLNASAARLLQEAANRTSTVVMHDWWTYQMITGAGGVVIHDDTPTLLYRQHADNEVGANTGLRAKMQRLLRMLRGDFRSWNDTNVAALAENGHILTSKAQAQLASFAALRSQPLPARLASLGRLGLYRQSRSSTAALWVAAVLGRL